jgi:hypothetical protein
MSDKSTQRTTTRNGQPNTTQYSYFRGLHASVRNNASAYGFSVTITATMVLLVSSLRTSSAWEVFAFAGGAVAAFALVELVVSGGYSHELEDEPSSVKDIGSSVSVISVGTAILLAYTVGRLVGGFVAWPLGSFVATVAYLFLFGVELGLIDRLRRRKGGKPSG